MTWSLQETDPHGKDWSEFLKKTPHLLFHESEWANVICDGVSSNVVCFLLKQNGIPMAGALGFMLGGLGVRIAYFNYPYGSLIGTPPPSSELVGLLRGFCKSRGICQLQLVGFPFGPEVSSESFETQPDSTHILNLKGLTPDSLLQSYRRSRRQDLRKARERGIAVEVSQDSADVKTVFRFYLETMNRTAGVARYKQSLLESIMRRLGPQGRARMYLARHAGEPIAGMLIVDSQQLAHGLLLASSDQGLAIQPNKLLLHTAASDCTERGLDGLDYMPSGQSGKGVSNFKTLWKADEVEIQHHTFVAMPFRSQAWKSAFWIAKKPPFRNLISLLRK